MQKPDIHDYQYLKFSPGYLTDNICSLIWQDVWDIQVDLHQDSWKLGLLKRPVLGELFLTVLMICLQLCGMLLPSPWLLLGDERFQESGNINPQTVKYQNIL